MSFDLSTITLIVVAALLYPLLPPVWRGWVLLGLSVLAIFWLQPPLPPRFADFLLPTITLALTISAWHFTLPRDADPAAPRYTGEDWQALTLITIVFLALAAMRYLPPAWRLTPSRPPSLLWLLPGLVVAVLIGVAADRSVRGFSPRRVTAVAMVIILLIFLVWKTEPLAALLSHWWRLAGGQDATLATAQDWRWLGFSYVAFRLLHTLRDRQLGQLPPLRLREYVTYALFFPAFIAGPIDRAERFAADFRALPALPAWDAARFAGGGWRILVGLLQKIVIADSLALGLALNETNAQQAGSGIGLWLLLYGYGLRLFFDFSGYTHIAIGLGTLFGVRLPENFRRPYRQQSITAFWQSWHITLSDWARFYIFTPFSRALLRRKPRPSPWLIVLLAQLATMIVIGLWHGMRGSFLVWGIWHGLGLFAHKQWSDRTRGWYRRLQQHPWRRRGWAFFSWAFTFHFVMLGWVWFLMPTPAAAAQVLLRLIGYWGNGG